MNLGELVKTTRREIADDNGSPDNALIKDWQLIDYANDAEQEACRRAKLLSDSSTSEICQIDIETGNNLYDLDPRVISIRRARLQSQRRPLRKVNYKKLDGGRDGWEAAEGTVEAIVTGMDTGKIRLYRIPVEDDTMVLSVVRLPLAAMVRPEHTPEINPRFHRSLVYWMKHKAYGNQEAMEIYDPKLSADNYALFEREFGPAPGAINEIFDEMTLPLDDEEVGW